MAIYTCGPKCAHQDRVSGRCGDRQYAYEGAVLALYERNGYDDSDFYAIVWDAATSSVKSVCYGSTAYWTYHNGASVDATPEVQEIARLSQKRRIRRNFLERAFEEAAKPVRGCRVMSTAKRGKNVGVVGVVEWIGIDNYKSTPYRTVQRFGVRVAGETERRYLSGDMVVRIDAQPIDGRRIIADADSWLQTSNWRSIIMSGLI